MAPSGRTQSPDGASQCYPLQGVIHPSTKVTVQELHRPLNLQIMTKTLCCLQDGQMRGLFSNFTTNPLTLSLVFGQEILRTLAKN